ncbi:NPTX2 [Branchiostoma lanceolatum]|uniref:NPTX2 protein n=1 Tax=Branchiostoma lanceolatum TaxID=7740 RepID=A0A8J9ZGN0_BRALA|nr:NPTX2 [Branchiostoma lanceolatum]
MRVEKADRSPLGGRPRGAIQPVDVPAPKTFPDRHQTARTPWAGRTGRDERPVRHLQHPTPVPAPIAPNTSTSIPDPDQEGPTTHNCVSQLTFPTPRSTSNYVRMQSTLPNDLSSLSLCVHVRSTRSSYRMSLVSYAVGGSHNELLLFKRGSSTIEIGINGYFIVTSPLNVWDGAWHVICATWRNSDGAWQLYSDGALWDQGSGLSVGGTVTTGGTWILGQDQDSVGGGFDTSQAFEGDLSQVNLWDRVLSAEEIAAQEPTTCDLQGNVIDWAVTVLDEQGQVTSANFECKLDGGWSDWGAWSGCSVTCGVGTETQDRTCTNPAPANGGEDCEGQAQEARNCDMEPCPVLAGLYLDDAGIGHLTVSWTVGSLPISRYSLRYQPADGSASYQDLSPAPAAGATSATVSGLLPDTSYNITLTSFGEDDQPNGVISGTYGTDSVVVNVECDQDSMAISIPLAALLAVDVANMHLLDDDCGATVDEVNGVVTLETNLQQCDTIQETSGDDKFVFSNEAIANQVTHANGAVRNQPISLPFQCEFLRQYSVSQGGDIMYNIPSPRIQIVDANNTFTMEMRMYTSTDFTASYESSDYPIQVTPSDRLNFGLSVTSPLDNLELFAQDCVSTPTTDPNATPRVNIIDDGCTSTAP